MSGKMDVKREIFGASIFWSYMLASQKERSLVLNVKLLLKVKKLSNTFQFKDCIPQDLLL